MASRVPAAGLLTSMPKNFVEVYRETNISHHDTRDDIGASMHDGPKSERVAKSVPCFKLHFFSLDQFSSRPTEGPSFILRFDNVVRTRRQIRAYSIRRRGAHPAQAPSLYESSHLRAHGKFLSVHA